ncbi:uncharacterized protein TNCT_521251 [Trichonephila clavata]|uniref:MADF domain-containing protein n=1 Tax=Trichonephila clavata TaxID=2740835 RepID=A0A8X6F161_TRICU|nr:uncharacterized protein TNCT_521251 [Trichonephila clavata]
MRNHDVLYNIRHPDYRKVQAKQHLWESIGITLEKSGSDSCKRWGYVRDYYIRRRGKPGSGSSGFAAKKRSELLSFLDSFATSQRPTTTNVGSSHGLSDVAQLSPTEPNIDTRPEIITPDILEHDSNDEFGTMEKFDSMTPKKKKKLTHSEERLKLLKQIAERKVAPQNEPDEVDLFFGSMAKIFKRFPRKEQAVLRSQITNLISNAEVRIESDASPACSTPRNEGVMLSSEANSYEMLRISFIFLNN